MAAILRAIVYLNDPNLIDLIVGSSSNGSGNCRSDSYDSPTRGGDNGGGLALLFGGTNTGASSSQSRPSLISSSQIYVSVCMLV